VTLGRGHRFDTHLIDARVENIKWLRSLGTHDDLIARQLGITRELLDKTMERHGGERHTDPGTVPEDRRSA
jgi:hypothetical protein